jgi:8-oxo-dGTP diphosphatase
MRHGYLALVFVDPAAAPVAQRARYLLSRMGMLAENQEGHRLVRLLETSEAELEGMPEWTHSRVVARHEEKVLLVFERNKQRWALPGGARNAGETPRHCAVRELREESSNDCPAENLRFLTAFELHLAPTRLQAEPHTEYGALYEVAVDQIAAFLPNEEIGANLWWGGSELSHELDGIDRRLAELTLSSS